MPTVLTYVGYFVEHIKDLLIDQRNPILQALYFGVIFAEVLSYEQIKSGSANVSQIPVVNELFKLAHDQTDSLVRMRGFEPPRHY
jgi:hypothetical protein